jgi:hypothetical protein
MDNKEEWIINNVDAEDFGVDITITCGHGRHEYFITLRQQDPRVAYLCCPGCHHMITGDILERTFTLRLK